MGRATRIKNEKALQEEAKFANAFSSNNIEIKQKLLEPVVSLEEDIKNYKHLAVRDITGFKKKTKSKNRDKQVYELVRFAFGKYPVCTMLSYAWEEKPRNLQVRDIADMKLWYICAASGGSLYKEHAKSHLSKKEVHNFLTCPHNLQIPQGLYYSVAKAQGALEGISLRIARSKMAEKTLNEFWKSCARFFADNPPESVSAINDLVDYLQSRLDINAQYSMAGNTLASLTKKMHDWHWELQRIKVMGDVRWEGVAIDDQDFVTKDAGNNEVVWSIKQIKNSKELAAEGTRMRHCVYSYKQGCVNGTLSIWSLAKKDLFGAVSPKVTIELRNDGRIAQARGLANRDTRPEEKNIIRAWAQKNALFF